MDKIQRLLPGGFNVQQSGPYYTINLDSYYVEMDLTAEDFSLSDDEFGERILKPALDILVSNKLHA